MSPSMRAGAACLLLLAVCALSLVGALGVEKLDYKADSAGCTPLTDWEKKDPEWWNWEARMPDLAAKVKGQEPNKRAAEMLWGLGSENMWLQIVDGWSHLKGANSFGPEYVEDMKKAFKIISAAINKDHISHSSFNEPFYTKIHFQAFMQTAHLLGKRNGYRGEHSGVYLPLPDKPLGVFHDIHDFGKMTYSSNLRRIDRNSDKPTGWKHNQGYLMRWVYPNKPISFGKKTVRAIFDHFWAEIAKVDPKAPEKIQRDQKLNAVVWLYHSLENYHCFIDGNGRTNILVLDTMLSWIGLHPVSFYNSMESALSSVEEMRQKILEGYFMWEKAYENIQKKAEFLSGWTLDAIKLKNKECAQAIATLKGKRAPGKTVTGAPEFVADTQGGCLCQDPATCDSNPKFANEQWCFTNSDCTWKWDFCAKGRRKAGEKPVTGPPSHAFMG